MPAPAAHPAVVLLSGGLDSATCLAVARSRGFICTTLAVDYGQRHRAELDAAARISRSLGAVDHRVIRLDLRVVGGSALTADIEVPRVGRLSRVSDTPGTNPSSPAHKHAPDAGIPITYVPARNLTFLSIAAGLAETLGTGHVFIGVNAVDFSGYPDCRPAFVRAVEEALAVGTRAGSHGQPWHIHTPLIELSKAAIIRLGHSLGVDFSLTFSCYNPDADARACGVCESCVIRRRGFEEAGIADPTRYTEKP